MIFDWRFGIGCWMLASFFFGVAFTGAGQVSGYIAAFCFFNAGVIQFAFDPATSRATRSGHADQTVEP